MKNPDGFIPDAELPEGFTPDKAPAGFVPDKSTFTPDISNLTVKPPKLAEFTPEQIQSSAPVIPALRNLPAPPMPKVGGIQMAGDLTPGSVDTLQQAEEERAREQFQQIQEPVKKVLFYKPFEAEGAAIRKTAAGLEPPVPTASPLAMAGSTASGIAQLAGGALQHATVLDLMTLFGPKAASMVTESNWFRKLAVSERALVVQQLSDEQIIKMAQGMSHKARREFVAGNPRARTLFTQGPEGPISAERTVADVAPGAPEPVSAGVPPTPVPAAPTAQPRPPAGSFEGTVLEFKIKTAMGLKPADHLTPEAVNAAFAAGKIPQDLAEQMGHPGAIQAAAAEAAKNAPPAPALAPEDAMIQQVVADKTKTHEALSEPHPVTGQKPYQMSETQYGAALREMDPNISGEDIAKSYEKLLADAKDVGLVDERDIEMVVDPAQQAEALAISDQEPADYDFDLMDAGPASLSAMPLDELQAKFPGAGEQLHRELVVEGLNAGQILPEQAPYADIKKAAIERVNQEQANVEKRQEAAAGSKTPILQMAWKRKFNRATFAREGFDVGALRGYFTEKGGMTPELATENAYEMGWIPEYDQAKFFEKLDAEMMRREGVIRSPEESYSPEPTQPQRPAVGELPTASSPGAGQSASPSARQAVLLQIQGKGSAYVNSIKDEPRFVKGVENAALAYEAAAAELGMAPTAENWGTIDDKLHQAPKGVAAAMNEKYGNDAAAKAADPAYIQAARWTQWHFEMGKPLWAASGKQAYDVFLPAVSMRSPIVEYRPGYDKYFAGETVPVVRYADTVNKNTDTFRGGTWYMTSDSKAYIREFKGRKDKAVGGDTEYKSDLQVNNPFVVADAILEDGSFSVINSGYEKYLPPLQRKLANRLGSEVMWPDEDLTPDQGKKFTTDILLKNGNTEQEIAAVMASKNRTDAAMDLIISKGLALKGYDSLILRNVVKDGTVSDRHIFKFAPGGREPMPRAFLMSPGQEYTPASAPAFYSTGEMPADLRDLFAMQSGEGGKYSQPAWHGSPHDFDKFLLHKIGTGEGAQAYGWGLYFAGDKAVAEHYRKVLGNTKLSIDGSKYTATNLESLTERKRLVKKLGFTDATDISDIEGVLGSFGRFGYDWVKTREFYSDANDFFRNRILKKIDILEKRIKGDSSGKLYEVEIPDSDKMLDWDVNLDEQPAEVQKALSLALKTIKNEEWRGRAENLPEDFNGEDVYYQLATDSDNKGFGPGPHGASMFLNSLGLTGIRYADGATRKGMNLSVVEKDGKFAVDYLNIDEVFDTRKEAQDFVDKERAKVEFNYVIFDDNLVQIVNKYSQPGAKYAPGHVYTPGELLTDEAGAGADMAPAVRDVRSKVRPVGQWHELRKNPAIKQIDKDFIEKQLTSAIGKKIDTIQDVAEIAAMARHPRIEHLVVVKLKKGKVIGSLVLTDGKIGYIAPNMAEIQAFLQDADEFYMSHNHPTGNPAPSVDDIESTKAMATDKRFKGHVVTDHQTYTAIAPDGTAIAQEYRGEKVSFRTDIEMMSSAPAVMGWVRGTLQGDKLGIMFVDPRKQVMSFDQVDPRSDFNTYITRKAPGYGASGVFLIAGESAMGRMSPRVLAGNYHDFLVINGDGMYRSASLGNVEGFSIDAADRQLAPESEGYFNASRYAETPADYNPDDYNKVLGRFKPGMALTLRNRLVTPQFPAGLPRGSVFELKSVAKTGEMLVSYKGKILTVAVTPNMFKETYREPGAPQPGQKERQFIDTVRGMEKTNKTVKDTIAGNYDVITNEVTLAEAKAIIAGSMDRAIKLVNETKEPTRLSNTVAMLLIDAMQQQGRFEEAIGLIEHTAERNTGAGQAIQALAMYRRLTPEGILRFADGVVRKAQDAFGGLVNDLRGLGTDEARAAFAKKHGIPYMSAQQASDLYDVAVEVAKMEPGRARDLATGKMLLKVSQLVPKGFWEKVSSLQILAQLLNPKTFIRNLVGNAAFMAFENFSQAAGVPLDILVGTMTGKRTIGMPGFMTQVAGFLKGAKEGGEEALAGIDLKQINNKFDLPRGSAFDSRAMRALESLLNISLKATDRAFYQAAFEDSLRVAMKLAKVTAPTPEMVSQAHLDGLYRTFNDDNALRTALVHVKRSFNLNQKWGLGDMVIKYPGTPASILMRGIEYSPFGFMQAVYTLAKAGSVANFDQRAFVQQTTRALNGSLLLVGTGMILSALGLIRGKDDDKQSIRETEAAIGVRDYQINLSGLIRFAESGMDPAVAKMRKGDQLVSYDWMQPMAINLAMGANIQRGVETSGSAMIADALQSASMTLEEQPLLAGISRFFSGRSLTKGVEATIKAIPASFVPTLVNQFRQLIDNVSRNTQSDSYLDAMGNQVKMKVPGLSGDLPPRVDALGRVRKTYQNDTNNPFNVFLNPAFVNRYEPTPATELVLDIWARSGETIQLPRIAPRQIKVRGVTRPLTEMEQAQFQHYIGERTAMAFTGLARNPDFLAAPDYVKAKHLQAVLTDIYYSARVNVLGVPPK